MIDEVQAQVDRGTFYSGFSSKPRPTALKIFLKASELKHFVLMYWLVLLDGHVVVSILKGLRSFTTLFDFCSSGTLCKYDLNERSVHLVSFFSCFERNSFGRIQVEWFFVSSLYV